MDIAPDFLSTEEVELLKRTVLAEFKEDEQQSFVRVCQRTRLDPFTKQIYATRRYQRVYDDNKQEKKVPTLVTITSIMGITAVADRTGDYDGCEIHWCGPDAVWKDEWLDDEPPAAARCKVYHKKRSKPEVAIARWMSYRAVKWDQTERAWLPTEFWAKMPDYMLGKCAKAAALRGAFPDPLANVFISEELDSEITDTDAEGGKPAAPATNVKIVESTTPIKEDPEKAELQAERAREVAQGIQDRAAVTSPQKQAQDGQTPAQSPTATSPQAGETGAVPPAQEPTEAVPAWRDHIITSIKDARFNGKTVGELPPLLLSKIETQWIPKVLEQWEEASDDQRADAKAFQAAIAASKMEKIA